MSKTTDDLKHEIEKSKEVLKTLGDEIRVKLHLAGMEAKDKWKVLSAEIEKLSTQVGHELGEQSRTMVNDIVERAKAFKDQLKG